MSTDQYTALEDLQSAIFKAGGYVLPALLADRVVVRLGDQQREIERLRAENDTLRAAFFQLTDFAAQQWASVTQRIAP